MHECPELFAPWYISPDHVYPQSTTYQCINWTNRLRITFEYYTLVWFIISQLTIVFCAPTVTEVVIGYHLSDFNPRRDRIHVCIEILPVIELWINP
jgi:hypothetical protein